MSFLATSGTVLAGFVAGGLGSLFTPWSRWGVEVHRDRRAARAGLVSSWRQGLAVWLIDHGEPGVLRDRQAEQQDLLRSSWYQTLRPHLAESVVQMWEKSDAPPAAEGALTHNTTVILVDPNAVLANPFGVEISEQISVVERGWKLI